MRGTPGFHCVILILMVLSLSFATLPSPSRSPFPLSGIQKRRLAILRKVLISDYLDFHRTHRRTHKRLVYRLSDFQPGIGDRMMGFIHAYISAVLSDRILLIDWHFPIPINDLLYPNNGARFYYNREDVELEHNNGTFHCFSRCKNGHLRGFGEWFTVVKNESIPINVRDVVHIAMNQRTFLWTRKLLGELEAEGFDDANMPPDAALFSEIFRAVWRVGPKLENFIRLHAGHMLNRRYISVHARLGEGVLEEGPRFEGPSTWRRTAKCMGKRALEMGQRLGSDGSVFLATDTPEFRELFRNEVMRLGGKWGDVLFGDWDTKHVARMERGSMNDSYLFKITLMEFWLLGRGMGMVSSRSRFAIVGAMVGNVVDTEVVEVGEC